MTTSPDPNMVKLFQISQLIIEFLVHSQNFLLRDQKQQERLVAALEEEVEKNTIDVEKLVKINHIALSSLTHKSNLEATIR